MTSHKQIVHVRDPGSHKGPIRRELSKIVIVQQKRISSIYSWTDYQPHRNEELRTYNPNGIPLSKIEANPRIYPDRGRKWRFHYRINVYEKVLN